MGALLYSGFTVRIILHCLAVFAVFSAAAAAARADSATEQATISGSAFRTGTGVIGVNQTSGNGNAQANVTAIGGAKTSSAVHQSVQAPSSESGSAAIDGFAFSGSAGIVQVNQSAGSGNAQANVVVVRASDSALADTLPVQSAPALPASRQTNAVSISKTAFTGTKGIVQISQIAGSGNRTSSTFVLQYQNRSLP